jgi:hypothetical protein
MTPEKFKRKLTAILSADVKGYSRLMGEDGEATVRTLQAYKEVMAGSIQHHRGRVVAALWDDQLMNSETWWMRLSSRVCNLEWRYEEKACIIIALQTQLVSGG